MAGTILIYPLVLLALVAVAIYVQVSSIDLSLPISLGTTVLTILLPFIAAANAFYSPALRRFSQRMASPSILQLIPAALQILQGILTVVLATLSSEGFLPGPNLNCSLQETWQRLWMAHDGRSIERIQDAFNCCGLNTIKDRAWPPIGGSPSRCSEIYRRPTSCVNPWRSAMQRNSGLEFGVAVAVGLFQLIHLALFRLRNLSDSTSQQGYKRITQRDMTNPERALLENGNEDSTNSPDGTPLLLPQSYGATEENPTTRVEPSDLGEDRNHWS